jgi:hypothetical protein
LLDPLFARDRGCHGFVHLVPDENVHTVFLGKAQVSRLAYAAKPAVVNYWSRQCKACRCVCSRVNKRSGCGP